MEDRVRLVFLLRDGGVALRVLADFTGFAERALSLTPVESNCLLLRTRVFFLCLHSDGSVIISLGLKSCTVIRLWLLAASPALDSSVRPEFNQRIKRSLVHARLIASFLLLGSLVTLRQVAFAGVGLFVVISFEVR